MKQLTDKETPMKKQTVRWFTMLSVAALLAVSSVHGYSEAKLVATIPFSFTVGETTLPAGQYTIRQLDPRSGRLFIRRADGRGAVLVLTVQAPTRENRGRTELVFRRYGARYFLGQVRMPGSDVGRQLPPSRLEQELAEQTPPRQIVSFSLRQNR